MALALFALCSVMIMNIQYTCTFRHDFDRWSEMGATGWSYEEVLPYFKKSERNDNPLYANSPYHGTSGPMGVTDQNVTQELIDAFLAAGEELGYPTLGEIRSWSLLEAFLHL